MKAPWAYVAAMLAISAGVTRSQVVIGTPSYKLHLCEDQDADLECPAGAEIKIIYANFGRTEGADVCPNERISNTNCTDETHTDKMKLDCDGKSVCTVWARNSYWGDTCYGTYKYLEVDWYCDGGDECPDDPYKTEPGECGCGVPDTDSNENGIPDCLDFQETPFPETPQSEAPEQQTQRPPRKFILCEGKDEDIECPAGEEIEIVYANYGRTEGAAVCAHKRISNTSCTDESHTTKLKLDCDGKNKCATWARNSYWGDTCYDTYKYLEVDYYCVGDECPEDPYKTEPGACGCGVPDTDSDGDGIPDCIDECPEDPVGFFFCRPCSDCAPRCLIADECFNP